ncbi:hypothetical protein PC123_g3153 [Phytophthora cactorum]|nr:hypothetical protein PC123_g3153 [Phytophthora cactorum]
MLALILLTRGQSTSGMPARVDEPTSNTASVQLRSSSRDRSLRAEDLVSSRATLVVAPDALVEHWAEQIDMHVVHQGLKLYVDRAENFQEALPKSKELAKYDVVIVPFSRMAKEWKLHRPASAVEKQNFSRYGFEDQPDRYIDGSIRGDVSSLLSVHWLRIVVDEGHKLGGRAPTQLMQMSRLLCAERRWVMTGTPSPNTLQSADLQYIHGLLVFLRSQPYGRPDGHAWTKAIARPFQRNEIMGFYRLQHLLGRIMIRHTKESIRDFLPRPIRHTVVVDPSPDEFKLYNAIAENVRASLVITAIDVPKGSAHTLGDVHPDSLLHRKNHHGAGHVESDLAIAFMGGYAVDWAVEKEGVKKTIGKLRDAGVNDEIWDKSVEQQVISRAHRMGATHSVVVEQLWMRGTVECQLTSMNQQLFKRERSGEDRESGQHRPTREEVQEASSAGKSDFQAMKMSYLLNNLRVLPDDVAGKDGEVRFSVLDESEAIIRQGVHTISDSGRLTTVSTMPTSPKKRVMAGSTISSVSTQQTAESAREAAPRVAAKKAKYPPEIIEIDDSSSDEEHKTESDSEDDVRVPLRLQLNQVKQEPEYIEIKDEDTESDC